MRQAILRAIFAVFIAHFRAAPGSIRGLLQPAELGKAVLTGLGASSLAGLAAAVLAAIAADSSAIFPSAATASAFAFYAAQVADLLRRIDHGADGAPNTTDGMARAPGRARSPKG